MQSGNEKHPYYWIQSSECFSQLLSKQTTAMVCCHPKVSSTVTVPESDPNTEGPFGSVHWPTNHDHYWTQRDTGIFLNAKYSTMHQRYGFHTKMNVDVFMAVY